MNFHSFRTVLTKCLFRKKFNELLFIENNYNNYMRFLSESNRKSWKVLRLNHVAIATNGVDKASNLYRDVLKVKTSQSQAQPEHGVNTIFVDLNNTKIELLDPIGQSKSPIWAFLQKNQSGGIHHLCLEVDDIYAAIDDLKSRGIRVLSDSPKIGAHGKPVVFLHPKDCNGVLLELEQV
jgi:methylmalonyl-CoA/ethylmalonyl-CoA epimerase